MDEDVVQLFANKKNANPKKGTKDERTERKENKKEAKKDKKK